MGPKQDVWHFRTVVRSHELLFRKVGLWAHVIFGHATSKDVVTT